MHTNSKNCINESTNVGRARGRLRIVSDSKFFPVGSNLESCQNVNQQTILSNFQKTQKTFQNINDKKITMTNESAQNEDLKLSVKDNNNNNIIVNQNKFRYRQTKFKLANYTKQEEKDVECPICDRPKAKILCQNCGECWVGRFKTICSTHKNIVFLHDYTECSKCHSSELKEIVPS